MNVNTSPLPEQDTKNHLIAVDRLVSEVRRGGMGVLHDTQNATLVMAAESAEPETLAQMKQLAGQLADLLVTGRRAMVMGLIPVDDGPDHNLPLRLHAPEGLDAALAARLAHPLDQTAASLPSLQWDTADGPLDLAAIRLMKIARLLPAAVVVPLPAALMGKALEEWLFAHNLLAADARMVLAHEAEVAQTLRPVGEARVPLDDAENTRVLAFRPADGGIEHLAIVIGEPEKNNEPVLTRLHSECFTGDLLGSLRCDCGDQLRGAIAAINQAGSGILLYLAQEGRGIGLVNKLRAYQLQDQGHDTLDANEQLGFDDDERVYLPAAQMLERLGISQIRLMTNNPAKVRALGRHGIDVVERVPHVFEGNRHSFSYLRTKATRSGHLF